MNIVVTDEGVFTTDSNTTRDNCCDCNK